MQEEGFKRQICKAEGHSFLAYPLEVGPGSPVRSIRKKATHSGRDRVVMRLVPLDFRVTIGLQAESAEIWTFNRLFEDEWSSL